MTGDLITWAEIDLKALANNVRAYQQFIGKNVEIIAGVKANAYGHGLVPSSLTMLQAGAKRLAVHRYYEGITLRKNGIQAPILIMGDSPIEAIPDIIQWQLTPTVIHERFAEKLSELCCKLKKYHSIHIKIDTGMHRYGLLPYEVEQFFQKISRLKNIFIEGVYTHFATADEKDQTYLLQQYHIFLSIIEKLKKNRYEVPLIHACNSAAAMVLPQAHFNAVRPGIGLYGLFPSTEWTPVFNLTPAMTIKSRIVRVRSLPAGSSISYGRTYIAPKPIKTALIPIGYGDGYPRSLSNKGQVLIKGEIAPVLGRVCMDQIVVDVSDINQVSEGDEVIILGRQHNQSISAEKLAELAGTINYEITTRLLPRVIRVYVDEDNVLLGKNNSHDPIMAPETIRIIASKEE